MGYEEELACSGLEWLNVSCIFMKIFHPTSAVSKYKIDRQIKKVKVSHNRPRWPKGFRVG
jgi:hypothetical protein